jgi:hypothetical protein
MRRCPFCYKTYATEGELRMHLMVEALEDGLMSEHAEFLAAVDLEIETLEKGDRRDGEETGSTA